MDYYTTTKEIFIPELLLLWTGEMVKVTPLRTLAYGDTDAAMGKTWDECGAKSAGIIKAY